MRGPGLTMAAAAAAALAALRRLDPKPEPASGCGDARSLQARGSEAEASQQRGHGGTARRPGGEGGGVGGSRGAERPAEVRPRGLCPSRHRLVRKPEPERLRRCRRRRASPRGWMPARRCGGVAALRPNLWAALRPRPRLRMGRRGGPVAAGRHRAPNARIDRPLATLSGLRLAATTAQGGGSAARTRSCRAGATAAGRGRAITSGHG